jgi:hypothetical protein
MTESTKETTPVPILVALDQFIADIFPTMFTGATTTNPVYKRIYALVSERKKQLAGKPNRVNDKWIIKTLTAYGGVLDSGQPRYRFESTVVAYIGK